MIFSIKNFMMFSLAFLLAGACSTVSLPQKAPAPSDMSILYHDPSLPDEVKALSGKWSGGWGIRYRWNNELYVEKVEKDSARIILAWGEFNHACHCSSAWKREKASIQYFSDKALLEFHSGTGAMYFTLKKSHPDEMEGMLIRGNKKYFTTMKKVQ